MMYALPRDPWRKPWRITSLTDVQHDAQKESVAERLGVPYTPRQQRVARCAAANALAAQVAFNETLFSPKDPSTR